MLSRIKNLKGGWGFVAGMVVTLLLVPTVAVAATGGTIIKGSPSGNKADVSKANQLLTTTAQPANLFSSYVDLGAVGVNQVTSGAVLKPPSGSALIVDHISANVNLWGGSPGYDTYAFYVGTANCSTEVTTANQTFVAEYDPNAVSYTSETDLAPGVPVPAGDALCMQLTTQTHNDSFYVFADATASVVPAGSVPSALTQKKLDLH